MEKLAEWKERILFAIVALVVMFVALQASWLGDGLDAISEEQRIKAQTAADITPETGARVLEKLRSGGTAPVTEMDEGQIELQFFDVTDEFTPTKRSSWLLGGKSYERLPSIELDFPSYAGMNDFDLPAGMRPSLLQADGALPRDSRPVRLSAGDDNEFED